MLIYDANKQILGRLSSVITKRLLAGERVIVVNAEKTVMSGNPKKTTELYLQRIRRGDPIHGPFFPRAPDRIFRRAVRGMLPWHKPRGRAAYRRLRVYIGLPEKFKNKELQKVAAADAKRLTTKYITLSKLSQALGAKKRW